MPIEHDPFLPQDTLPGQQQVASADDTAALPSTIGGDAITPPVMDEQQMAQQLAEADRSLRVMQRPPPSRAQVRPDTTVLAPEERWQVEGFRFTPTIPRRPQVAPGAPGMDQPGPGASPDSTVTMAFTPPEDALRQIEQDFDPRTAATRDTGFVTNFWRAMADPAIRQAGASLPRAVQSITGREEGIEVRAADSIDRWLANDFPINPAYRDNLMISVIAPAIGSAAGFVGSFILGGAITKVLQGVGLVTGAARGVAAGVGTAGTAAGAAAMSAGVTARAGLSGAILGRNATQTGARVGVGISAYAGTAEEGYRDALAHGASFPDMIATAQLNGVLGGALDVLPVFRAFSAVDATTGNSIQRAIARITLGNTGYRILETGASEMLTEAAQTVIGNLIASGVVSYDPTRGMFQGVPEAMLGGFTGGAFLQVLASMLPGGRRVHFPGGGGAAGTGGVGPMTPIGPVPFDLLRIADASTRVEPTPMRTGIEGHEETYFALPPRENRSEFMTEQVQRIRDLDDAWKRSNPEYVGDPIVGASLEFYSYLQRSERDFDRLRKMSPEQAARPDAQARLREVEANREVIDMMMDPVRLVSRPLWVLQRSVKGKAATFIQIATDQNGQPIRRDGKKQRVVGVDGKDYFIGNGQLMQIDNPVPHNYVLSPQGQNMLRLARMRMEAERRASDDMENARRQAEIDAAGATSRTDRRKPTGQAALPGSTTLALPPPQGRVAGEGFTAYDDTAPASPEAVAQAVAQRSGDQSELFAPGQTTAVRPDATPSGTRAGPLKPPPLTPDEQLTFDTLLSQSSGEKSGQQARTAALGSAAMQALIGQRVALEDLPSDIRSDLDVRAVRLGVKLPDAFTQEELVTAGVPENEAVGIFNRIGDFMRARGAAATDEILEKSTPPRRGVEGIMEWFKDLPPRERRQLRKLLMHFERHIGHQLADLDIIDLANWLQKSGSKYSAADTSAAFLYGKLRELADGVQRAAVALQSVDASGANPSQAKAIRLIAHELTHFMVGLTRQSRVDMTKLWVQLAHQMPNDPTVQEVIRLYGNDPRTQGADVLAQEYLAFKLEEALSGRFETEFEKLEPGQAPSLLTYIREFIRRTYQFVLDTMDTILGRDIIGSFMASTSAQFDIDLNSFTLDTQSLQSPYPDDSPTRTADEIYAKRKGFDATVPEVRATVADYYAVRFKGPRAYEHFNEYMEREFKDTWAKVTEIERRATWESATTRMAHLSMDAAYRSGVLVGAPKNPRMITELLGMAKRGEGKNGEGRLWYQLSAEEVHRVFRDHADMFLRFLAVTSPGASVVGNTTQALSAMAQAVIRGKIETDQELGIKNVGFEKTVQKYAQSVLATGDWAPTAKKTHAFYQAMANHLGVKKYGVVVDRWMLRALGYTGDSPNAQQYVHASLMLDTAARALGWQVDELQAAIWVAVKMESAKKRDQDARSYGDFMKLAQSTINFEIAPSDKLAVGRAFASMGYDDRLRITARLAADVLPTMMEIYGITAFNPQFDMAHGGYLGVSNPSLVTSIALPEWAMDGMAAMMGLVLKQDSILITKPQATAPQRKNPTSYFVVEFKGLSAIPVEKAGEFWAHAQRVDPRLKGGYSVNGNKLYFFNMKGEDTATLGRESFAGMSNAEFKAALHTAAASYAGHDTIDIRATAGNAEARLISNDWKANPNGEGYRKSLDRIRPGLSDQLHGAIARSDAIIAEELEAAGLWSPRRADANTVGRPIAPSIPLGGPVDVFGPGGRRDAADTSELAGRQDAEVAFAGIEHGSFAQSQIYARAGVLQGGVDTTESLKVYKLDRIINDPAAFQQWLAPFQVKVETFAFTGENARVPRVKVDGYHKGKLWIYDPSVAQGSFKDTAYTHAWRVSHELGHGVVENLLQAKYGPSNRYGRLGRTMTGQRGVGPKAVQVELEPLTLRDVQRAVEWEDAAFRAQRVLLQDFGVEISDDQFGQEYNTNLIDAVYRATTGEFGDPGEYGFVPSDKPIELKEALRLLEQIEFSVARAQGRDPTRGVPLDTEWEPISDAAIRKQIDQARTEGLAAVAANPRDDFQGEFFVDQAPSEATKVTSPLAFIGLYTALLKAPMKAARGSEWKKYLRTQQVSLDEVRWSGIFEWLDNKSALSIAAAEARGVVTREMMQTYGRSEARGVISREMVQAYVQAAELIVDSRVPGTLSMRSNPLDVDPNPDRTQRRPPTVVSLRVAPRHDDTGRSLLAITGIATNQSKARTDLAVRRAMRWAAQEGFDGVTWLGRTQIPVDATQWSGDRYRSPPGPVEVSAYMRDNDTAYISSINVDDAQQRSGLGRSAVQKFEQAAALNGASRVTADAVPASVEFWRRMGYEVGDLARDGSSHPIEKKITPVDRSKSGPLDQIGETAGKVAKAFASKVSDTKVVVSADEKIAARSLDINDLMSSSTDDMPGLMFARIFRRNPPPPPVPPGTPGHAGYLRRMIRWYQDFDMIFTQSSKRIRLVGGRVKSAFILGNHFRRDTWSYIAPGVQGKIEEDYHSVLNGMLGSFMPKLSTRLNGLSTEARAELPIAMRGGNRDPVTGNIMLTDLSRADAIWFRSYLNEIRMFMNDHMKGIGRQGAGAGSAHVTNADLIKHIQNYFPQIWKLDSTFGKGSVWNGVSKAAVAHEFFKKLGFFRNHPQQDQKITDLINLIRGESGFVSYAATNMFRPGSVTSFTPNIKDRLLKIDPNKKISVSLAGRTADVTINDLLENNPVETLLTYVTKMSRHAEFNRRFGPDGQEITRLIHNMNNERHAAGMERLSGKKLDSLIYQVHGNLHSHQKRFNDSVTSVMEWTKTFTNANLLFFTTVASTPEIAMPAVRLGLRAQMTALGTGVKQLLSSAAQQGPTHAKQVATDLGIIRDHFQSTILQTVADYGNFRANRVNDWLFQWTGLNPLTRLTMTMGTSAAMVTLPRWSEAAAAGSGKHRRWLNEVGLEAGDLTGVDMDTYIAGQHPKIDAAIRQIVGEIVINPTPGMLPGWHTDPRLRMVSHIKSFMTGFGNTVVQRPLREAGEGNLMPLVMLGLYAALAASTAQLWEWVKWGAQGSPSWRRAGLQDSPQTQFMLSMVSRGGIAGSYQMFIDMVSANRTASGGSSIGMWIPGAAITDRIFNLATGLAQVMVSGGDNPTALRTFVDAATQLTPGISASGRLRTEIVDAVAPQRRSSGGTGRAGGFDWGGGSSQQPRYSW